MTEFTDPSEKIDKSFSKMDTEYKSKSVASVFDNLNFARKVRENPVITDKYDRKIFGVTVITFDSYLKNRVWPRSMYVTDKLIRLAVAQRLEFLQRYLKKKRPLEMNWLWLFILIALGLGGLMLVVIFLLPRLQGAL